MVFGDRVWCLVTGLVFDDRVWFLIGPLHSHTFIATRLQPHVCSHTFAAGRQALQYTYFVVAIHYILRVNGSRTYRIKRVRVDEVKVPKSYLVFTSRITTKTNISHEAYHTILMCE